MATAFSDAEKDQLVSAFEKLNVKPKMDDEEALTTWMYDYLKQQGKVEVKKEEKDTKPGLTHVLHDPRVSLFSGCTDSKNVSYEVWRFEVLNLLREKVHSDQSITTAVKKSLRGEAGKIAMRLGVYATVHDIIDKFEGIYGTVEDAEDLLAQYYSATQKEGESVAQWGCRLEDLLDRVKQTHDLRMDDAAINSMLMQKYWSGLQSHLKQAARHKLEHVRQFDKFRIELRKIETEYKDKTEKATKEETPVKKAQVKMATAESSTPSSEMEAIKGMICSLTSKVDTLQQKVSSGNGKANSNQQKPQQPQQSNSRGGGGGGGRNRWNNNRGNQQSGNWYNNRGNQQSGNLNNQGNQQSGHWNNQGNQQSSNQPYREPKCYRCGQFGHIEIGCRANMRNSQSQQTSQQNTNQQSLNEEQSIQQGQI